MKKILCLGACVASLAMASSSAFAAVSYGQEDTLSVRLNDALTTITVDATGFGTTGQRSLLVTGDSDSFIYYIDQAASATDIFSALELRLQDNTTALQPGKYTVKVGNDQKTQLLTATFEITDQGTVTKKTVAYGDVNGDTYVNTTDATLVLKKFAGLVTKFEDSTGNEIPDTAGDVNGDTYVNTTDATLILKKFAGLVTKFEDSTGKELTEIEY